MCKNECNCGCESVSDLRLKYQRKTGNRYDRQNHFYKTEEEDPYIRFLEEELLKKDELKKKNEDELKKIIDNEL